MARKKQQKAAEEIEEITAEEILAQYQEEQPENQDEGDDLIKVDIQEEF